MRRLISAAFLVCLLACAVVPVCAYDIGHDPQYVSTRTYMPKLGVMTDIGPLASESETAPLPLPQNAAMWIFNVSDNNQNVLEDPVTDFDTWADPSEVQSYLEFAWQVYVKDTNDNWILEDPSPYISGCAPFGCYSTNTNFSFSTTGPRKIVWKMKDVGQYDDTAHPAHPAEDGYDADGVMYIDVIDNTIDAPNAPVVQDDGDYTSSPNTLHASWTVADAGSGIMGYQYQITDDLDTVVRDWTTMSRTTAEVNASSLGLVEGRTYYFHVKAYGVGVWSDEGVSDGITYSVGSVIHVSPSGSDNNNGSTWALAKRTIGAALGAATSGKEVWIAQGMYCENITLPSGVGLYGGFNGDEVVRTERSPKDHETILDGTNAGSVVTIGADATPGTVIDGFTIRNGSGTYASMEYRGGGIYCASGTPTISHNTITGNEASDAGGGIYLADGGTVSGNVIIANGAQTGGGIRVGAATVVSNTIVANDGREGGGIACSNGATVKGNIIAFNCSGIYDDSSNPALTIDYNCLYGNRLYQLRGVTDGEGNIFTDPKLAAINDTTVSEFTSLPNVHIQSDSPCRNAITDGTMRVAVDMDGQSRDTDSYADMGADESDGSSYTLTYPIYRVIGASGNDSNDGSGWDTTHAMASIQAAVEKAAKTGGDVWVKTSQTFNQGITMRPFVYLIGSCDGTETTRPSRDNPLNGSVITQPMVFGRVIVLRGGYHTNLIDGFEIKGGKLTGPENGAGILCSNASPAIRHNTISGNQTAHTGQGGGIYCYYGAPEITRNTIGQNVNPLNFSGYGAGIKTQNSIADIRRNIISYNEAYYDGGGMHIDASVAYEGIRIENNYISYNLAVYRGSGIYILSSGDQQDSLIVAFNTIESNRSYGGNPHMVGAVYMDQPNQIKVVNNIVSRNYGGLIYSGSSSISVVKNCVYFNDEVLNGSYYVGPNYSSGITHDTDINDQNPQVHDHCLQFGSPCIDTANSSYSTGVDIEGKPRPRGSVSDIGCCEY